MIICLPYDLREIYPFFCRNYGNMKYSDLMKMGYDEFTMKVNSVPNTEPLYNIFKSRTINPGKIKNKEERDYWTELKNANAIPDLYKSSKELNYQLMSKMNQIGGLKNAR